MARNAHFIPPYWIDLCNQRLPSCLEVHAHCRVSRAFKDCQTPTVLAEIPRHTLFGAGWLPGGVRLETLCVAKSPVRREARGMSGSVESRCGAVVLGSAYRVPALSVAGDSLASPWQPFPNPAHQTDAERCTD